MRLGLLASISWMVTLTIPLLEVFGKTFSGRDLIMLFGGVFLLFKATMELHERLEGHIAQRSGNAAYAMFWPIVAQIVIKVHRRSVNRHGSGKPEISNGQTLGGVKSWDWRGISGSSSRP